MGEFDRPTSELRRLVGGSTVRCSFIHPLLSVGAAALVRRQPEAASRLKIEGAAKSYAETVGLMDVLEGREIAATPRAGRSYSPLARLDVPETVEAASQVIVDFVVDALGGESRLTRRIARVIGELHDNVASHSRGTGYSAAQHYGSRLHLAIADSGVGLLRNARSADASITADAAAIEWCLARGNTSAKATDDMAQLVPDQMGPSPFPPSVPTTTDRVRNAHKGEGLWQLVELVRAVNGRLLVWTGTAISERHSRIESRETTPGWQGLVLGVHLPLADVDPDRETTPRPELEELAKRLGI